MTETKPFALGAVLTITTGRLLCPMDEVYAIMNHLTGDEAYTHQIPRVMHECRPWLLRWFPACANAAMDTLDDLIARDGPQAGCQAFLTALRKIGYPATYEVPQMPQEAHDRRDPLAELVEMVGPERVIVVQSNADTI